MKNHENSQWGLPRYRYQELRNFCLQYPDWQDEIQRIISRTPKGQDPTGEDAVRLEQLGKWSLLVSQAMDETVCKDIDYSEYKRVWTALFYVVTHSPRPVETWERMSRDASSLYRQFFWHLDKIRG